MKRDYRDYDRARKVKDRHRTGMRRCDCGVYIAANKMLKHKREDDVHLTWEQNKWIADRAAADARNAQLNQELELKSQMIIDASLPFFCSSDPVPSVSERIRRESNDSTSSLRITARHMSGRSGFPSKKV
jgi:hypothetical protein